MTAARLDKRVLGAGLLALGVASVFAVAADAARPASVAAFAVAGGLAAWGVGRRRPPAAGPDPAAQASRSVPVTVVVLVAIAAAWLVVGAIGSRLLDDAGLPKRAELFALADGLVAAAGLVLMRARQAS